MTFNIMVGQALSPAMFLKDNSGQDLIEYSLLLAFIALAGAVVFIGMGSTTSAIWTIVNSRLASANQSS